MPFKSLFPVCMDFRHCIKGEAQSRNFLLIILCIKSACRTF